MLPRPAAARGRTGRADSCVMDDASGTAVRVVPTSDAVVIGDAAALAERSVAIAPDALLAASPAAAHAVDNGDVVRIVHEAPAARTRGRGAARPRPVR